MTQDSERERYPIPQAGWHLVDFGQFAEDPVPPQLQQLLQLSGQPVIVKPKVEWALYATVAIVNQTGTYQRVLMN